ncbi:MAG: DUF2280 domain-containing protein [Acidobacteria bacterium]|nr:DUF2280 domain-containing protein [Acidobacteriota bacterium]
MADLSDEVKEYIVQELALYKRPAQVTAGVKAFFDLTVDRRHVQHYDPTKGVAGKRLGPRWVNLFHETRSRFDAETAAIPIAKQSYRLAMLQRMAERAEGKQQFETAARLLEQVARELGGMYTNTRKLKIDDPRAALADLFGCRPDELPAQLVEPDGEAVN